MFHAPATGLHEEWRATLSSPGFQGDKTQLQPGVSVSGRNSLALQTSFSLPSPPPSLKRREPSIHGAL